MRDDRTAGAAPPAELTGFLLELGRLLLVAGDAVSDIERRLRAIARVWDGPEAQFMVLPNSVVLTAGPDAGAQLVTTVDLGLSSLRLDQVTEVLTIARAAERGELSPGDGLAALQAVPAMVNRYTGAASIVGQVVLVVGIALIGAPLEESIILYAGLGLLVALMREGASLLPGLDSILPVAAATVVSAVAFLATGREYDVASIQTLVPPLVPLLPGAMLTMAVVDLASGETVTGASRFLAGLLQLALLAFGIVAGAALVGVAPPTEAAPAGEAALWIPLVGVLVFAGGIALQRSVPPSMLPWLLVVLFAAFAGQLVGEALFGAALSGFVGGLVAAPLALGLERFRSAPPAFVAFLPAFWLLVPGAVGLLGVSQLVIENPVFGLVGFVDALTSIVAIALGILVGVRVVRAAEAIRASVPDRRGAGP